MGKKQKLNWYLRYLSLGIWLVSLILVGVIYLRDIRPFYVDFKADHYLLQAIACRREKKLDRAVAQLEQAIRVNPRGAFYHNQLGDLYKELKQYDKAIFEYQEAVRLEPDYHWYHQDLGSLYKQLGRYDEAIEEYKQIVRIWPNSAHCHWLLGNAYREAGFYEQAIQEYQEAVKLTNYVDAYLGLGDIYRVKGETQKAVSYYRKYLELKPDAAEAGRIREFMKKHM